MLTLLKTEWAQESAYVSSDLPVDKCTNPKFFDGVRFFKQRDFVRYSILLISLLCCKVFLHFYIGDTNEIL